ncbi:MAG TPA: hypothetical protein PLD14_01245 [Candidatus Pacearchaeota archaeon]|nr:hypothetical protein [Candidatus Pacearchaeota archaeon]HPR79826.1 hypothetical protein [Candidatus Pacearchaeota archaeon]
MKNRTKILIGVFVILSLVSVLWFDLVFLKHNGDTFEKELMKAGETSDVVIVFNSGGWGTVPFDQAFDFNPIINETKELIESKNYKVSIVQYYRTQQNFFAKVASLKETLFNFPDSSRVFSDRIDEFLEKNPNDKVIIAGLSNGASFIDSAMEDLKDKKDNVWAIELGAPFWKKNTKSENIISLNNQADILANGKLGQIIISLIKTPFIWIYNNISGNHISLTQAMHVRGHDYYWQEVKDDITSFVNKEF